MTMICPLRLINIADQPEYNCVPSCAMLRIIDNGNEYNLVCGLGDIPLPKGTTSIVNFDSQPKPPMPENEELQIDSVEPDRNEEE